MCPNTDKEADAYKNDVDNGDDEDKRMIMITMKHVFKLFKQEFFQYRIEADGENRWGAIWEAPLDYTFLSTCDKQTQVEIIKKFDSWDENSNLAKRMPRLGLTSNLLLSSTSVVDDTTGTLVYNSAAGSPTYLKERPNPSVVRYWMREGTR